MEQAIVLFERPVERRGGGREAPVKGRITIATQEYGRGLEIAVEVDRYRPHLTTPTHLPNEVEISQKFTLVWSKYFPRCWSAFNFQKVGTQFNYLKLK